MTSIRRSDDASFHSISSDPEVHSPPPAKADLKAVPPATNQVEAHRAPPSNGKTPDKDLVNVSTDLIKGYVHPGIFEDSRPDLAQKELSRLPPREFSAVMNKLEQSGSLERFLGQLSPEQKTAFLDTAVRKGALQKQDSIPAHGSLNPPTVPAAYSIQRDTPLALAKAANQSNLDAAGNLYAAQQKYLDRYEVAAKKCNSGAELRALGPYAKLETASNPIDPAHPQYQQLQSEWIGAHRFPSDTQVQTTISNRLSDFMGEAHAGSLFAEGKIEVDVKDRGSAEVSGRIYDSGKSEKSASAKAWLLGGVSVGSDSHGKSALGVKAGELTLTVKGDKVAVAAEHKYPSKKKLELELETDRAGVITKAKAQYDGTGVSFDDGKGRVDIGHDGWGGYAFLNPHKAEFGGGVKKTFEFEGGEVKLEGGMGMQGLSSANAAHALNHFGIWESPRELLQGKSWKELDATTQDAYRRRGWSEQEWTSKVKS